MRFLVVILMVTSSGCSLLRSRYAMDDPVYADKYHIGAEQGDLIGKAKQALDARHTSGLGGVYVSGGVQVRPDSGNAMAGGEIGGEFYQTSWATARGSIGGYIGEHDVFGGLDLGVRLQTPTRLAPFVGIGAFGGLSKGEEPATRDGIDNDDDGFIDETSEKRETVDGWLSLVYPEVGVHFWLDGNLRLTTFGRYLITSQGRDQDEWLLGVQLSFFSR